MAVGDVPAQPHIRQSIKQAWNNMWPNFWWLLLFGVLVSVLPQIFSLPGYIAPENVALNVGSSVLALLVSFLVVGPLGAGLVDAHLATSRGEKPTWHHMGYGFRHWGQAVLLVVMVALITAVGFILLVIPGIYVAVRLTFATYRFVHDDLDAWDAIKASWEDTRGRWWHTFALGLMGFLLFIAGLLALGVGVFVAMVLVSQMTAVFWRSINEGGPKGAEAA